MDLKKLPLILLLIALFLLPLLGGQLNVQTFPMTDFLSGIRGPELPQTARFVVCSLVLLAGLLSFRGSKIAQLPSQPVFFPMAIFVLFMGVTCGFSAFSWISWSAWLEWVSYAAVLLACVAILGRTQGPVFAIAALGLGCAVLGMEGILEYGSMKAIDPTWRIFTSWVNSNALGGMLLLGIFASMGLMIGRDRMIQLGVGAGVVLMGFALVLTQSKGTYLGAGVGLLTFGILLVSLKQFKPGVSAFTPWVLVIVLAVAMTRTPSSTGGTAIGRVGAAETTQVQSEGFRKLLWQSSIQLMKMNPVGFGPGTFRYEVTRPAITPQTVMAHQGFLQIGVEGGIASLIAWIAFLGGWGFCILRGIRNLSPDRQALLAGIIAAVAASCAHNFIDSDWQHFGIGASFFALLGIGLLVCADGAVPEYLPKQWRQGAIFLGVVGILAWGQQSLSEINRSSGLAANMAGNRALANDLVTKAVAIAPGDGDSLALLATTGVSDPMPFLQRAATETPSPKNLRTLARFEAQLGEFDQAKESLSKALQRDPSNLSAHKLLIELALRESQQDVAEAQLAKMLRIEDTTYFTVRAIPERIPTETYEARLAVARNCKVEQARYEFLEAAVKGFELYAVTTIPRIRQAAKANVDFAGDTKEDAIEMMNQALEALTLLQGDSPESAGKGDFARLRNLFTESRQF